MKRSKLLPIMRLTQRRVLWMFGVGDKILDEHEKDKHFDLSNTLPYLRFIRVSEHDKECGDYICVYDYLNKCYKSLLQYDVKINQ